ncbi:hypothetical protein EG028_02195 [Chitinophaga barathri]|uniref:Uncharacterized protein n=1 Tax=Chitinophaga barathri TaxID=1647451 RepID=A0A3N4MM92_9BACT|nr:hypothetical protein EG028_02195 [Chitinophaga barathri]
MLPSDRTQGTSGISMALLPEGARSPAVRSDNHSMRLNRLTTIPPASITRMRNGDLQLAATLGSVTQQSLLLSRLGREEHLKWQFVPTVGTGCNTEAEAAWEKNDGSFSLTGTTEGAPFCVRVEEK